MFIYVYVYIFVSVYICMFVYLFPECSNMCMLVRECLYWLSFQFKTHEHNIQPTVFKISAFHSSSDYLKYMFHIFVHIDCLWSYYKLQYHWKSNYETAKGGHALICFGFSLKKLTSKKTIIIFNGNHSIQTTCNRNRPFRKLCIQRLFV